MVSAFGEPKQSRK
jgi:hypothetical protein